MIKSNLPAYSPLTVSRQRNENGTDGDQTHEGRNTLSVSMSDTPSSAFNAHSPPYIRRPNQQQRSANLDMEDIYANHDENMVAERSATDFHSKPKPQK